MPTDQIPLSAAATTKDFELWSSHWGSTVAIWVITGIVVFVGLIIGVPSDPDQSRVTDVVMLITLGIAITFTLIMRLLRRRRYLERREDILAENAKDYHNSLALAGGLGELMRQYALHSVKEDFVPGEWRPFRVEHHLSQSIRGELSASVQMYGWWRGEVDGRMQGRNVPNLMDDSAIVFLQGPSGTLRVLLPSPTVARETITRILERCRREDLAGTHLRRALDEFALNDRALMEPLTHPQLIDHLDASCQLPAEHRPVVGVAGQVLQPGVVVASAVQLGQQAAIFMPTGFFQALTKQLESFFGPMKPVNALESVK